MSAKGYALKQDQDCITHDGRRAKFVAYNYLNWPAPFCFSVNGTQRWYSTSGFHNNHQCTDHGAFDLVGPWLKQSLVADIMRDIFELPDRTSPEDQPDMMMVTEDELRIILDRHINQ